MRKIILLIVLVITSTGVFAQHTISGIVIDSKDATLLLEGVNVFIPELNKSDVSKEGGTYILTNVGIGVVHLQFTKPGYKTEIRTNYTKDSAVVENILLEKSILPSAEITNASLSTTIASQTILPSQLYNSKELSKVGSMNMFTALTYKPEVDAINNGNSNVRLSIRGSGIERVSYYLDNVNLDVSGWDDKYAPGINTNGIKSFEIVRGPATLLYGANASSGVCVMHSEDAEITGKKSGDVNFKFNSNTLGLGFEAGFKGNSASGFFYSLRLGGESNTSYIQGEGSDVKLNTEERPFAGNSKFNSKSAKLILGLNQKWGMTKISYSHLDKKNGLIQFLEEGQNLADGVEREREIVDPYQNVKGDVLTSNSTIFIGKSLLNVDLSYQSATKETFEKNLGSIVENSDGLKHTVLNYNIRYTSDLLKNFSFTIGTQGGMNKLENKGTFSRMSDSKVNDVSGFAILNYKLKKVNFQFGGRYDSRMQDLNSYFGKNDTSSSRLNIALSNKYSDATGSFGLSYHATKVLSVRANAATGFSTPNALQLTAFSIHSYTDRFEVGTIELKQEKNIQIDLSTVAEFSSVSFEVRGFANNITDYIYSSSLGRDTIIPIDSITVDTFKVFGFSQSDAKLNGLEFIVSINPEGAKWFKLDLSYGLVNGKFTAGGFLPFVPTNKLVGSITISGEKLNYVYKPYMNFTLRNYFARKNVSSIESTTDSYALIDINLGGSFRWGKQFFDLNLSVNNLLNTNYFDQFSSLRSLGTTGTYNMGRNVSLQLRIPFGFN